jgi:hypothetical protein
MTFRISTRFIRVWQRNLTVYRESWKINFNAAAAGTVFYLLAFGIGFSGLIGSVDVRRNGNFLRDVYRSRAAGNQHHEKLFL